tara:strand:- start:134 stop:1096 length:963 start_codon:yes stop_codon:yes gene_type:complete
MKFEPVKLTKIIEQNYSHLMPDFFEMQTEYLASLNVIYNDLDASLVAMVLTSELYKNTVQENNTKEQISLKYFYQRDNYKLPASSFKIKEISTILNLPRETVRRKKEKLIKDKLIILDKKKKLYTLNTDMVEQKIVNVQIDNLSKFLSKFSVFFSKNKFFVKEVSRDEIKKDVEEKFLLYLTKFLDFQISYFSQMKTLLDIESIFILLLCELNTTAQIKEKQKPMSSKAFFSRIHDLNNTFGLNATSISEITKVPRTTVLRKISHLEKIGMLKKDKFKRYTSDDVDKVKDGKRIALIMNNNVKLLSIFFSQCLETFSSKN